jgi:hypothetical protein
MSDYIERQKVKDIRFSGGINHDGFLYVPYKELVDGIKALPSADVVVPVRCKDCEWATKSTELPGWYMCKCEEAFDYYAKPDDFCSYGKRREEEA